LLHGCLAHCDIAVHHAFQRISEHQTYGATELMMPEHLANETKRLTEARSIRKNHPLVFLFLACCDGLCQFLNDAFHASSEKSSGIGEAATAAAADCRQQHVARRLVACSPPLVAWRCLSGPPEWKGRAFEVAIYGRVDSRAVGLFRRAGQACAFWAQGACSVACFIACFEAVRLHRCAGIARVRGQKRSP